MAFQVSVVKTNRALYEYMDKFVIARWHTFTDGTSCLELGHLSTVSRTTQVNTSSRMIFGSRIVIFYLKFQQTSILEISTN